MSNEERVAAIQRGENREENLEQLYYSNMPLWLSVLRSYSGLCDIEDLKQEAFLSIMEAVRLYDPARGAFASFACLIIRQDVPVYLLSCGNGLSCPAWLGKRKERYLRLLEQGVTDPEEQARLLGVTVDSVRVLAVALGDVVGLDDIEIPAESFESSLVDDMARGKVWEAVTDKLSGRRLEIIQALFIGGESVASLADRFGVSVQRINQLKEDALKRLRGCEELESLAFDLELVSVYAWRSGVKLWKRTGTSCEEKFVIENEKLEQKHKKLIGKEWKELVKRVRGA